MKLVFSVFTLSLLLVSCASSEEVHQTEVTEEVEETAAELLLLETIHQGALFGAGEEGIPQMNKVIRSYTEWLAFIKQMDSVNPVSQEFNDQSLNFDQDMVIVCFDQVRESGGYQMHIKTAVGYAERIDLFYERVQPEEMATSVMTQPYSIAKIPQSELPVTFIEAK